jgi:hypothetical protein
VQLTFNDISELIFGAKPGPQTERLSGHFDVWVQGLAVLIPINLPFTKFGTAMKVGGNLAKGMIEAWRDCLQTGCSSTGS